MKLIIKIMVPIIAFALCLWGDIALVKACFEHLPQDLSWLWWARAGIIFVDIWLLSGVIILTTVLSGIIADILTS